MVLPTLTFEEMNYEIAHQGDNKQASITIFTSVLLGLCYVAVVLRLLARHIQGLRLAWNDYTIIIATFLVTAMCAVALRAVNYGLGLHIVFVGTYRAFEVAKLLYALEVLLCPTNFAVKLSILLLYHSIFGESRHKWFNVSLRLLIALWLFETLLSSALLIFQCVPINLSWTSDHSQNCLNLEAVIMGLTIWSVVLNFATLILPMPLIWELKLSIKNKISLALLFGFGGVGFVTCVIRAADTKNINTHLVDFTWLQAPSAVLGLMEMTIDIICACIATFRPIFKRCRRVLAKIPGIERTSGHETLPETAEGGPAVRSKTANSVWTVPFMMLSSHRRVKTPVGINEGITSEYPSHLGGNIIEESDDATAVQTEKPLPPHPPKAKLVASEYEIRNSRYNSWADVSPIKKWNQPWTFDGDIHTEDSVTLAQRSSGPISPISTPDLSHGEMEEKPVSPTSVYTDWGDPKRRTTMQIQPVNDDMRWLDLGEEPLASLAPTPGDATPTRRHVIEQFEIQRRTRTPSPEKVISSEHSEDVGQAHTDEAVSGAIDPFQASENIEHGEANTAAQHLEQNEAIAVQDMQHNESTVVPTADQQHEHDHNTMGQPAAE